MSNVSITDTTYNITVAETDTSVTVSSGDAITVLVDTFTISTAVVNTGSGAQVGKEITGDTLYLRSITAGDDIVVTQNTDDITIALASSIDANLTGDTSGTHFGNVQGDLTGNVTGNVVGNIDSNESSINVITDVGSITNSSGLTIDTQDVIIKPDGGSVYITNDDFTTYLEVQLDDTIIGAQSALITGSPHPRINVTQLTQTGNRGASFAGAVYMTDDLDVSGMITGDLTGDVVGNLTGDVTGQVSDISNHTTTDLAEGTNLYYTDGRFDTRFATKTTTDLTEGDNLYYTQARFDSAFAAKDTGDLTEGSNLYYTDERVDDRVDTLLQAGPGIALDYNDADGELTITSDLMEEVVKNATGATLLKGTPVYVSGVSGDKPTVDAARADDATKMPAIGVLNEDIANDAEGSMLIMGRISGVDTSAFSEGDTIYVAPTGGYTNTKPTSVDTLVQNLGFVTKVHATNGGGIVYGSGRANDTPNEITHTMIPSSNGIDLGAAGDNANDNTQSYFGRIYGQQLYTELLVPRNGSAISVNGDLLPTGNIQHDLGSVNNQWRSAYIGPGSLYIDGQKVLGSDVSGAIDMTTDAGQNLNISSGADIQFLTQGNATGTQAFTVNLNDINLGPSGGTGTTTVNGTLEAPDLHIGDLELEAGLINYNQTGQNLEIRTNGTGYLHANTATAYFGSLTQAVSITGTGIGSVGNTISIVGDLTGDVTGQVSDVSNHTTDDISEGTTNLYYTDARSRAAISASGSLSYNSSTGEISYTQPTNVSAFTNDAGYLTSYTETDPIYTASSWYSTTNNSANWNTAYGWGDHSVVGYLTDLSGQTTSNLTEGSNLYFTDARAISAVEGEATLDLTGDITISQDLDVSGLIKVNDGFTLSSFNPYSGFGGTAMPTTIMGVGQESGWGGVTVRSRGEHDWGLSGFGIPAEAPRALVALQSGRLDGSSDDYLNNDDKFAQLMMNPYSGYRTGTEWLTPSAIIEGVATEDHSSSGMGTKLRLWSTPNGEFAGATDAQHAQKYIDIQGRTITSNDLITLDEELKITGDLELNGALKNNGNDIDIIDRVVVTGSVSTKNTTIGDDTVSGGLYDVHGFVVRAGDTSWASVTLEEYVGGASKPGSNGFSNPTIVGQVWGGTPGSEAAVPSGKRLAAWAGQGSYDDNGTIVMPNSSPARIVIETTENQTSTGRGAKLSIDTTPDGSTSKISTVFQGNEVVINPGGAGKIGAGGNLLLTSQLDTNNQDIVNTSGDVRINDNLIVTGNTQTDGNLTVDGTANLNGNVNLGNANTDTITATGKLNTTNGFRFTVLDTATANYLSGVLGIVSAGDAAYISDGDSGNPCLAVYNGSSWKRIAFGSDISSS